MAATGPTGSHAVRLALPLATAALLAAACGGGGHGTSRSGATGSTTSIATRHGSLGTYLTDGAGRTLYAFAADHGSQSSCYGSCATYWPPLMVHGTVHAGTGATAGLIGTTSRHGGQRQATYGGHPLYYYVGDHGAGSTTGQGLNLSGGFWWVVSPAGAMITGHGGTATSSTPTGGGYGGGY